MMDTPIDSSCSSGSTIAQGVAHPHRKIDRRRNDRPTLTVESGNKLTWREDQVLELICHGVKKKTVAERLGLSVSTINTYCERIYEKFGASSSTQLLLLAVAQGVVRITPKLAIVLMLTWQMATPDHEFFRPRTNRQHTTQRISSVRNRTEQTV